MIAVDELDGLTSQTITVCIHVVMLAETEITEKIQSVVGLDPGVQSIHYHLIHLPRIRERAIAISDDVEMSKVKVGLEPSVSHVDDYAGMPFALIREEHQRLRWADPHDSA